MEGDVWESAYEEPIYVRYAKCARREQEEKRERARARRRVAWGIKSSQVKSRRQTGQGTEGERGEIAEKLPQ